MASLGLNELKPEQNGHHFMTHLYDTFNFTEIFHMGQIDNNSVLDQVMAWRQTVAIY